MIGKVSFQAIRARYKDLLRFMVFLRPYWKIKLFTFGMKGVLIPLGLVMPYLTKLMIDRAYGNKDWGLFIRLAIAGAGVFVVSIIIEGFSGYLDGRLNLKISFDLSGRVFRHLQGLPLRFFQDKSTGEHIFVINFDVERLTSLLAETLPQCIYLFGRLLLTSVVLFYLNWKMALLSMGFAPLLMLQPVYFTKKRRKAFTDEIDYSQSVLNRLLETLGHMHLVKAFGTETREIRNFLDSLRRKMDLSLWQAKLGLYDFFAGNSLRKVILGILSLYGGYQIIRGSLSLGDLTAIMLYANQLAGLCSSLYGFFEGASFGFICVDRVKRILDTEPEIADRENAVAVDLSKREVQFQGVTFGYQPGRPVLKNLSFSLKPESFIALVGYSGCGKTTLLNLILRLYEVQGGEISFGEYGIKDIRLESLKSQIGVALQEPFLWNDTVANNIRYAKPEASLEEIKNAAKAAQIDEFIESLPQGYDTNVGEMAGKISEGQKQRLAIARAVIKRPAILILDEAMSSLDSQTEERIIENLRREFPSGMVVVVSHRLSTVRNMDWVYFLEAPDKLACGRHSELLENNPQYRKLFAGQLESESRV